MNWDDFWRLKWLDRYPRWIQLVFVAMFVALLVNLQLN
jgi:hypothetical protein